MGVLIVLLILAFIAWNIFTQVMARQETSVPCSYDPTTARAIVSKSFGIWWTRVQGRGDDNFRAKRSKPPVISISYDISENGGCNVDIWCSSGVKRYGVLNHAQLVWRKKRAVARALSATELSRSQVPARQPTDKTLFADSPKPRPTTPYAPSEINHSGSARKDSLTSESGSASSPLGPVAQPGQEPEAPYPG